MSNFEDDHSHPEIVLAITSKVQDIVDTRMDKMEKDLKGSIDRLADKVDVMQNAQMVDHEKIIRMEVLVSSCDKSREDQGRRIGELRGEFEQFRAVQNTKESTTRSVKEGTAAWVRWLPTIITCIIGIAVFIISLV